jgi:hypothetical protein
MRSVYRRPRLRIRDFQPQSVKRTVLSSLRTFDPESPPFHVQYSQPPKSQVPQHNADTLTGIIEREVDHSEEMSKNTANFQNPTDEQRREMVVREDSPCLDNPSPNQQQGAGRT